MSVFTEQSPTTENNGQEQQASFLEQLVAKKGETFRDPEAIAKKALHADEHIEQLKSEVAKLKAYEELIEGLKKDPKAGLEQINKPKEEPALRTEPEGKTTQDGSDIESQLELLLAKREVKQKTQTNLQDVEIKLAETFGERASEVVRNKAAELGMSLQRLSEMAAESPKAFYNLVGVDNKDVTQSKHVTSTVNTEGRSTIVKNRQYYEQKLRENPKLISNAAFGQEMYAAFAAEKNKR